MDLGIICIFVISGYLFPETFAHTSVTKIAQYSRLPPAQRSYIPAESGVRRRINPAWVKKYCSDFAAHADNGVYPWSKNKLFKRASDGDDSADSGDGDSTSPGNDGSTMTMTTLKGLLKRIPQVNFYSSIPNAVGVVGQGFSVLEKLSTAMGTPLPYWIGSLPIVFFGIALIFIPDLTTLNLPGFYPSGAGENDPLAAFPRLPNLDGLPDVDLSLNADNIPPHIIPVGAGGNSSQPASQTSIASDGTDDDASNNAELDRPTFNPTNPNSFIAPRRRVELNQLPSQTYVPPPYSQFNNNNNVNRYNSHRPT